MSGFFYLDGDDTRRRAALLTLAVRPKLPRGASLQIEYARTRARIGKVPLNKSGTPRVVSGGPILRLARSRGLVDDSVKPSRFSAGSQAFARRRVQHGLLFLRVQHPPLRDLCDLLLGDILVWPSVVTGGGSASNLLGIAWLVPDGELTTLDVAESIVHEMVHMNLHLADMTVGLYTRAPGTEFEAHSAVLRRRRPYHHAFHSACVATSIIYYRLMLGLDEDLYSLRSSLRRCTSELMGHRAAFTGFAWEAICAARTFAKAPRLSAIPVHRDLTRRRPNDQAPAGSRSASQSIQGQAQSLHE